MADARSGRADRGDVADGGEAPAVSGTAENETPPADLPEPEDEEPADGQPVEES